jgi:NADP-dependent 3-hydroxy acid dehydrogenase YdfG
MFTATINAFNKVDILVNNAGIANGASFLETTARASMRAWSNS